MSQFLPLFPLQIVVFPGEDLNLHIFEPRYKELIKDCEEEGITFGIPAYIDKRLMKVGTEVKLASVEKRYDNGELDIKTKGHRLFTVEEFQAVAPDKLYAGGEVEWLDAELDEQFLDNEKILDLTRELFQLLNIQKKLPEDIREFSTFDVAHHVGLSLEQEYQLLCFLSGRERQDFLIEHLERLLPMVKEMENLKKKAQLNGHFKHLKPPQI
ncbi:MAG: LON peptidase substrate-binding domain-containing protein [Saprospiraceae bacterium]|nr:LON peptidase substrate-binding domain-containing protein [Saprospiraceae bacterium]